LQTGDVHFATLPLSLLPKEGESDLKVFSIPNVGVSSLYLGGWYSGSEFDDVDSPWIQRDNPEAGRAIREAMSVAIDREGIVNELLAGEGTPLVGPIHFVSGIPATDPEWVGDGAQVPKYDPERARELLAEGGYPDGFDAKMVSFEVAGLPFTTDISEAAREVFVERNFWGPALKNEIRDAVAMMLTTGPFITFLVLAAVLQNLRRRLRGTTGDVRPSGGYR